MPNKSFTESDPFIVHDAPHVYFAGNQPTYNDKWADTDGASSSTSATKILSVPTFLKTRKFVLLDLQTLDTYDYKIDVQSFMNINDPEPE